MREVIDFNQEEYIKKMKKNIPTILIIILVIIFAFEGVGTIGAGERGVLLQFGAVQKKIFNEGIYFKIPFIQKVQKMDVKIQKDEVPAIAASKDLQVVSSTIALNYHINPLTVNKIWQKVGENYNIRIIAPAIQEAVKAVTAQFTAEELITKREIVKDAIQANLTHRLARHNVNVVELNITSFEFSSAFNEAIEAKVTAEQLKLKAERDLERIRIEAQQRIVDAEAKAKAIQIEAEALGINPKVIELRWVEKWNGETPTFWGGATPFVGLNQ